MAQSALDVEVDRSSDVPLGTQLAWKLRGAIAGRRLRPGDRLPGVRELAAAAGVNVNTVRAVYARLAEQGVIVSEHGRGTFVSDAALRDDLIGLAERTAREARRSGVDPRELAALLYAGSADDDSAAERRALRDEIEAFEREYAEIERELAAVDQVVAAPERPVAPERPASPRILSAAELRRTRDALAARVAELRTRLAEVRERERVVGRASRGIASSAPETVVSGGTWTLRWRL